MSLWQTVAMVMALMAWLQSAPANLADLARREALRRQLMPRAARSLTNQDVADMSPSSRATPPPAASAAAADAATTEVARPVAAPAVHPTETHDEAWWQARMIAARAAVDHDQLLADSLQSRINALTNDASARDDPAQRAVLYDQRHRTIAELEHMQEQVGNDKKAIDDIQEDARRQGVPAGWIR